MKQELYYAPLDLNTEMDDIQHKEFAGVKARLDFIFDTVLAGGQPRVFLLAIDKSEKHSDIYVFEDWNAIRWLPKTDGNWPVMHLHEYDSYEEAYAIALGMKEAETDLCYSRVEEN